jgi:hypothetical protein
MMIVYTKSVRKSRGFTTLWELKRLDLSVEAYVLRPTYALPFMDCRMTVSGVDRGAQRAIYDQRRREVLPQHGIALVELS